MGLIQFLRLSSDFASFMQLCSPLPHSYPLQQILMLTSYFLPHLLNLIIAVLSLLQCFHLILILLFLLQSLNILLLLRHLDHNLNFLTIGQFDWPLSPWWLLIWSLVEYWNWLLVDQRVSKMRKLLASPSKYLECKVQNLYLAHRFCPHFRSVWLELLFCHLWFRCG